MPVIGKITKKYLYFISRTAAEGSTMSNAFTHAIFAGVFLALD